MELVVKRFDELTIEELYEILKDGIPHIQMILDL